MPKDELKESFVSRPSRAFPGVCWYFMDGNLSREEMARIRESMKDVGIINLIFLEVAKGWINCLLRDQEEPDANVRTVKFENGPMSGKENTTGRSRLLQKLQCVHLISLNRYPLDCWILLQYRKK